MSLKTVWIDTNKDKKPKGECDGTPGTILGYTNEKKPRAVIKFEDNSVAGIAFVLRKHFFDDGDDSPEQEPGSFEERYCNLHDREAQIRYKQLSEEDPETYPPMTPIEI